MRIYPMSLLPGNLKNIPDKVLSWGKFPAKGDKHVQKQTSKQFRPMLILRNLANHPLHLLATTGNPKEDLQHEHLRWMARKYMHLYLHGKTEIVK
jgi:hypothetical protein